MSADLTREQAREQIAAAVYRRPFGGGYEDAALTVLWPVVESLRADLAHAHTVIARHVEPKRKPCRPEAGDCCTGDAHTWQPSESSRLPDSGPAAAPVGDQGSGRVEMRGRGERG